MRTDNSCNRMLQCLGLEARFNHEKEDTQIRIEDVPFPPGSGVHEYCDRDPLAAALKVPIRDGFVAQFPISSIAA